MVIIFQKIELLCLKAFMSNLATFAFDNWYTHDMYVYKNVSNAKFQCFIKIIVVSRKTLSLYRKKTIKWQIKLHPLPIKISFEKFLTFNASRCTMIVCQLSVEKAMAKSAADTKEKMDAKHRVTALQKAILETKFWAFCFNEPWKPSSWIPRTESTTTCGRASRTPSWIERVLAGTTSGSGGVWG